MVLDDQTSKKIDAIIDSSVEAQHSKILKPASPFDRLAAFVVDSFIIISPILTLFLAPLVKEMNLSAQFSDYTSTGVSLFYMIIIGIIFVVLYNTFSLYFFGQTIGKKIFKISIVNIWSHKRPSFLSCFFREFIKIFQVISFFPLFSLISTEQRRLLHDRIAETAATTDKNKNFYPQPIEVSFARGFYYGLFALIVLLVLVPLSQLRHRPDFSITEILGAEYKCQAVSDVINTDKIVKAQKINRLQLALTLYLTRSISESCFVKEVNNVTGAFNKHDLYLAKLVYLSKESESSELFQLYSKSICSKNSKSELCQLANIVSENKSIIPAEFTPKGLVARAWVMQDKISRNDFGGIEQYSLAQWPLSKMGEFISETYFKTLWSQKKYSKAEFVIKSISPVVTASKRDELLGWSCFQGLLKTCDHKDSYSCQTYNKIADRGFEDLVSTDFNTLLANHLNTCQGGNKLTKAKASNSSETKLLVLALNKYNSASQDSESLVKLVHDVYVSSSVRNYALLSLINRENVKKEIVKLVVEKWRESSKSMLWESIGEKISKYYFNSGEYKTSSDVISELEAYRPLSEHIRQRAVVAHYKSKQPAKAWSVYAKYFAQNVSSRAPASKTQFQAIKRSLIRKFKK